MTRHQLTRREALKLIGAGTIGAYLAGCAPIVITPQPASAPQTVGFDPKRYAGESIFVSWSKHPFTDAIVNSHNEFEELTGIKVEYEIVPEQQQRQKNVIQMSAQSSEIDIWESGLHVEKRMFSKGGWYHYINDYLEDPTLMFPDYGPEDIGEGAWELAALSDGSITGLPLQMPSIMLAYRQDLLEAKGLKLETLADLEAVADALHDPPNVYGFVARGLKNANVVSYGSIFLNMGGNWLDQDRQLAMTSPEAVEALDLYGRLLRNYGPPGVTGYNWNECQTTFLQGQAAIWIDGSDLLSLADDPTKSKVAGNVSYQLVPEGDGGQFAPSVLLVLAINPYSNKKEPSFFYNQWATMKKQQLRALLAGAPVVRTSTWQDPEFLNNTTLPEAWINAVAKAPEVAKPMVPEIVPVTEFRDVFGIAITSAIEGGDPEELLQTAQAEFEPIYAKSEEA
jgi:multiple sugar transport system substrate-binding protein